MKASSAVELGVTLAAPSSKLRLMLRVRVMLTDEEITVKVKEPFTVDSVKQAIEDTWGLSDDRQVLVFRGKLMNDSLPLLDYGITNDDVLRLIVRRGTSVVAKFRDVDGGKFHLTLSIIKNTSATGEDVVAAIESTLQVPGDVQALSFDGEPWVPTNETLAGVTELGVLPLMLATRPHVLVDAMFASSVIEPFGRFRRFPFNRSVQRMHQDIAEWLTAAEELKPASAPSYRLFFQGRLLEDAQENSTLASTGLVPFEDVVPLDFNEYPLHSRVLVLERNTSETLMQVKVAVPAGMQDIMLYGLAPSDTIEVVGELLMASVLTSYDTATDLLWQLTHGHRELLHNQTLADYGISCDSTLVLALQTEAGGWEAYGSRSRALPN